MSNPKIFTCSLQLLVFYLLFELIPTYHFRLYRIVLNQLFYLLFADYISYPYFESYNVLNMDSSRVDNFVKKNCPVHPPIYIKYLKSYDLSKSISFCFDIRESTLAKSRVTGKVLYRLSPLFQFILVNIRISSVKRSPFDCPKNLFTNNGEGIPRPPLK